MADRFWSRKSSKFKVISATPSFNFTQRGSSVVVIGYGVSITLDNAEHYSDNVFTNGYHVYHSESDTPSVQGDQGGKLGGVTSGTVGAKSEPIYSDCSPNVFINGNRLSRSGDRQYMQGRNTTGLMVTSEAGTGKNIKDTGEFDYGFPDDMDADSARATYKSL